MRISTFKIYRCLPALLVIGLMPAVHVNGQTASQPVNAVTAKTAAVNTIADAAAATAIKVRSFPNPFIDKITFTVTSPVSGKGVLELYDLTGRRLDLVYQGEFQAGVPKNIEYKVNLAPRTPILYKFGIGLKTVTNMIIRYN
ncbi:MAG: hypothetical protein JO301_13725 [Chitinophagaceae bacterium]|nr:hypothetical protein [Chitinophagaceae bacterium]